MIPINLSVVPETVARVRDIKRRLRLSTMGEAVGAAVKIAHIVVEGMARGDQVVFEGDSARERLTLPWSIVCPK